MLAGDSRAGWRSGALPDPRVTHLWDAERVSAQWFARQLDGEAGFLWDTYLLYGPAARWEPGPSAPTPLLNRGATVVRQRAELQARLWPLLAPVPQP